MLVIFYPINSAEFSLSEEIIIKHFKWFIHSKKIMKEELYFADAGKDKSCAIASKQLLIFTRFVNQKLILLVHICSQPGGGKDQNLEGTDKHSSLL